MGKEEYSTSSGRTNAKLTTAVVALTGSAIVTALFFFNKGPWTYEKYIVGNLMALIWVPLLIILFVLKDKAENFGLTLGGSRKVWLWTLAAYIGMLVVMFVVSRSPEFSKFQNYYPIYKNFWNFQPMDMKIFWYFEFSYGMYMFAWEFFFRGYLLQGMARSIGWWAILPQAVAFLIMHYGKVPSEFYSSFFAGIILGVLALRAKSFLPCFVLHWLVSLTFDVLIVFGKHA